MGGNYIIFLFVILFTSGLVSSLNVNTGMYHNANEFSIEIGGYILNLQEALDNNYLANKLVSPPSSNGDISLISHNSENILININGKTTSLQNAINNELFFGNTFSDEKLNLHHSSNDVNILLSGKYYSFQNLINKDNLCAPLTCSSLGYTCNSHDDGCGNTIDCGSCTVGICSNGACSGECTVGSTGIKDCDYLDSDCKNYADVTKTCQSNGYWNNPTCNSYSTMTRGTTCESNSNKACDSNGNCVGWSGAYTNCPGLISKTQTNKRLCNVAKISHAATVYGNGYSGNNYLLNGNRPFGGSTGWSKNPVIMEEYKCNFLWFGCSWRAKTWKAKPSSS